MIYESNNRLIKHLVNRMREITTDSQLFRGTIEEISHLILSEALANRTQKDKEITTWAEKLNVSVFEEEEFVFVPILRAGEPMLTGILRCLPNARSGFLAMKRNEETAESTLFYENIPDLSDRVVFLLDPMIATAGSLLDAIKHVKAMNPKEIVCLNIIGATEGIELIKKEAPYVSVYIAQIDPYLDENKYIRPGLGDAGDRAFNSLD